MESKIINLRHPENIIIKKPHFRRRRKHLLREINQSGIHCVLGFLRLSDIYTFYQSLSSAAKLEDTKDMLLHYLMVTKRYFTKWEEQEFLDCILMGVQIAQNPPHREWEGSAIAASSHTISDSQQSGNLKNLDSSSAHFENSILRQQIDNDVQRTEVRVGNQKIHNSKCVILATHETTDPCPSSSNISRWSELISPVQVDSVQSYMNRVLLTILRKQRELGYIQGFNYIVRNMYLTGFSEAQAIQYMFYFLEVKQLGRMLSNKMVGIRRLSYVLKVYLFNYTPKLYHHFQAMGVDAEIFSTSWFVTLFSEDLPPPVVNKLWRLFVIDDWKIFIQFVIALLCIFQQPILGKDRGEIFAYMRRILAIFSIERHRDSNLEGCVWKLMASVRVSDLMIRSLAHQMETLQHDCEIQLWKLQLGLHQRASSRTQATLSSQDQVAPPLYGACERVDTSQCCTRMANIACCDRLTSHNYGQSQKAVCLFDFCQNAGRDA